jgi:arginine exporter protein ArgO
LSESINKHIKDIAYTMNRVYICTFLGIILMILGIEQIGANSEGWHWTLAPWLSAIVVLFGVYFLGKAWDLKKKK